MSTNEFGAAEERDSASGRRVRWLTPADGRWVGPPYHTRGAFDAGWGSTVVEETGADYQALVRVRLDTGAKEELLRSAGPTAMIGRWATHETNGWVVVVVGRALVAVRLDTRERRVVVEDFGAGRMAGCPAWSLDGRGVWMVHYPWPQPTTWGEGAGAIYEWIDFPSGRRERVWEDMEGTNNHIQVNPVRGDLLLIDRDRPPGFNVYGDERATSRAVLLETGSGRTTELETPGAWKFHMHTSFNRDGTRVYSHGRVRPGPEVPGSSMGASPMFVMVSDLAGRCVWRWEWPEFFYGHVGADMRHEAILTDGLVSRDLLCSIRYPENGDNGAPVIEVLGRHGSSWSRKLGQAAHPHPVMTPDGRAVIFNRGSGDEASRVGVLELEGA
jgi:hypothetical protein